MGVAGRTFLGMNKILLLCSSGPGLNGVGGVLIGDALQTPGVGGVSLAALVSLETGRQLDASHVDTLHVFPPPEEFCPAVPGRLRPPVQKLISRRLTYDRAIKTLAAQVGDFIRAEKPDRIWAILNSTAVIDVLHVLRYDLDMDLLPQVWDDPEHLCRQRRLDRLTTQRTIRRFHDILRRAKRTAVICEEMAKAYHAIVPGRYVVIRHGISTNPPAPKSDPSSPTEFRIGLSGSMYSPSSWKAFQQALDRLGWKIDDRQVVLIVVGGKIDFLSRSTAECRFFGWRPPEEALRLMTGCDLLYLPQAFEGAQEPLTRLSFPTKLSTYAATGRPVFIHTPAYGSLVRFCESRQTGLLCNSLQPDEIAKQLEKFENPAFRKQQAESISELVRNDLNQAQFAKGVSEFLGTTPEDGADQT